MSDIVERLRADGDQMRATGLVPEGKQPLAHEAADAITTLRAENAAATDLVNEYSMAIIRMQGERDTLRAALESVDEKALEVAAKTAAAIRMIGTAGRLNDPDVSESFRQRIRAETRAAVSAYLAALKDRVQP